MDIRIGMTSDGELVEVPGDMFRIKDEIESRWPRLKVQYLDPDRAGIQDPPYRVVEMTREGPRQVLAVWELNQAVIDRLHLMNSANIDVLAELEKHNAKKKEAEKKAQDEHFAEGADMISSVVDHFGKGKLEFKYTNKEGQKRVIKDGVATDKEVKVL
jgi:hypothetical protein